MLLSGGNELYQWDTDESLVLEGIEAGRHVHFARETDTEAVVVVSKDHEGQVIADIPNELLQTCGKLYCFIMDESNSTTEETITYRVKHRAKPADYVYTPTEILTWETMDAKIGEISALETEDKSSLVAAMNEVKRKSSEISPEQVDEAVGKYLTANPVQGVVKYDEPQTLTDEEQAQARENINALGADELPNAVNTALAQAKESGEFKGEQGPQGEIGPKGDTGEPGTQGEQGLQGPQGEKGDPGEAGSQGEPGADGMSCTHSWNGTTLTITSASGTSSADLKGEKGEPGEKGESGEKGDKGDKGDPGEKGEDGADGQPGKDGYTPKKGVDYFDGEKGEPGEKGESGEKGEKGDKGDTGEQGPEGPAGPQGEPGEAGFSPSVSVSKTTNGITISVTNADGTTTQEFSFFNEYTFTSGDTINILEGQSEYRSTAAISTLTINYPTGQFEAWLKFTTASTGAVTITLPESKYIGEAPVFGNGETWELSIKDGVIVAAKCE